MGKKTGRYRAIQNGFGFWCPQIEIQSWLNKTSWNFILEPSSFEAMYHTAIDYRTREEALAFAKNYLLPKVKYTPQTTKIYSI